VGRFPSKRCAVSQGAEEVATILPGDVDGPHRSGQLTSMNDLSRTNARNASPSPKIQ